MALSLVLRNDLGAVQPASLAVVGRHRQVLLRRLAPVNGLSLRGSRSERRRARQPSPSPLSCDGHIATTLSVLSSFLYTCHLSFPSPTGGTWRTWSVCPACLSSTGRPVSRNCATSCSCSHYPFPLDLLTAAAQPVLIQHVVLFAAAFACARRGGSAHQSHSPGWSTASSQPGQVCAGAGGSASVDQEPKWAGAFTSLPSRAAVRRRAVCAALGEVFVELVCLDGPRQRGVALPRCGDGGQAAAVGTVVRLAAWSGGRVGVRSSCLPGLAVNRVRASLLYQCSIAISIGDVNT